MFVLHVLASYLVVSKRPDNTNRDKSPNSHPMTLILTVRTGKKILDISRVAGALYHATMDAAAVGLGAVAGALCRHQVGQQATKQIAKDPKLHYLAGWHTAAINVFGSFILGGVFALPVVAAESSSAAAGAKAPSPPPSAISQGFVGVTPRTKLLAGVGFCGSFTTFSTYSVDIVNWLARGESAKALTYVLVNNVGGIGAAACGMFLVRKILVEAKKE